MKPITLEIVTRVLTTFGHCRHCEIFFDEADIGKKLHQKDVNEYPPDLADEYLRLSDWIRELAQLYRHRLSIRVIDVQSLVGLYKSFRHRIRRYPAFIVEGKEMYAGWDKSQLEQLLDKHIKAFLLSKQRGVQPSLT
jgi:hypothetical protein